MTHCWSHTLTILAALISISGTSRADAVLDWNEIAMSTLPASDTQSVTITQLAVFEAVNAITQDYEPYLGTVSAHPGASAEAAAIVAAHGVLRHYAPTKAADLDAAREISLAAIADGAAKKAGIRTGKAAAQAMIELRANDGSTPPAFYQPTSSEPGEWQLTANCSQGVLLHLGDVTPFGIKRASHFRADPPPSLHSIRYAIAYNEVKRVGGVDSTARPQDRADVARFYAAVVSGATWNPVARQLAIAQGGSLADNARALALVNVAMSDALVAVFDSKYQTPFWRPVTAIHAGDADGNRMTRADPNFEPSVITTPCHPSYPSAHASGSYAARAVLEHIYGRKNHLIELSTAAVPDVILQYTRLDQITSDIDDARVYGGIHFRFDQQAGARQGWRVGEYVTHHNLCPRGSSHGRKGHGQCRRHPSKAGF